MAFDVVVIGAGIAGASVAHELAADRRVLLLETEPQPGYHSTGRSAAVYVPAYEFHNQSLLALTRASRNELDTPSAEFHAGSLLHRRGLLYVANHEQRAGLEASYQMLKSEFPAVEWVDPGFINRALPNLAQEYTAAAIFDPDAADIDVHGLHQAYLRGFRRRGGQITVNAEALAIRRHRNSWHVMAAGQEWSAPVLVNAAGAWADHVAELAGVARIGIQALRRTAVLLDPPPGAAVERWPIAAEFTGKFYFKPDAGLLMVSPADETPSPPCDARPEELDVAYATHFLEQALGMQVEHIRSSWAGLRSFVADRTPVVGYAGDANGFFWLAGLGGHGIQTAPATARLAAALVRGESPPADLQELGFNVELVLPNRLAH